MWLTYCVDVISMLTLRIHMLMRDYKKHTTCRTHTHFTHATRRRIVWHSIFTWMNWKLLSIFVGWVVLSVAVIHFLFKMRQIRLLFFRSYGPGCSNKRPMQYVRTLSSASLLLCLCALIRTNNLRMNEQNKCRKTPAFVNTTQNVFFFSPAYESPLIMALCLLTPFLHQKVYTIF